MEADSGENNVCAIISLPFKKNYNGDYLIERENELLEILRDLLACTGVEVRREVRGKEEFYLLIAGESVELNGSVDLSRMAAAAGYKLSARNMKVMGVQVLGTVLNKNVSMGDDLWGFPVG